MKRVYFENVLGVKPFIIDDSEGIPIIGDMSNPTNYVHIEETQKYSLEKKYALRLMFDMGNLVLEDNLVSNKKLILSHIRTSNKWHVLLEALIKSSNNNPARMKLISHFLLRKNTITKNNPNAYKELDVAINIIDKFWKYVQTTLMGNDVLKLFREKTSAELKFKFRSAVTFEEIQTLPSEDTKKVVKILEEKSGEKHIIY